MLETNETGWLLIAAVLVVALLLIAAQYPLGWPPQRNHKSGQTHDHAAKKLSARGGSDHAEIEAKDCEAAPDEKRWVERGTVYLLAAGFVVAIYAGLEAKRLADDTQTLVDDGRQNATKELRAYVSLTIVGAPYPPPFENATRFAISLTVANGGRTPPKNLVVKRLVYRATKRILGDPWSLVNWNNALVEHPILSANNSLDLQWIDVPLTEFQAIQKGDITYNFMALAQYRDVIAALDDIHKTEVSVRLQVGIEKNGVGTSFTFNPTHNCTDQECTN